MRYGRFYAQNSKKFDQNITKNWHQISFVPKDMQCSESETYAKSIFSFLQFLVIEIYIVDFVLKIRSELGREDCQLGLEIFANLIQKR